MSSKCQFVECKWEGDCNDLFEHCERYHKQFIREIINGNRFDFALEDLQKEAFLLCGNEGLYWFVLNPTEQPDKISRGVFHVGESEIVEYTLKLGLMSAGLVEYTDRNKSQKENSNIYELEFDFEELEFFREEYHPTMALYFGEYDDSDDVYTGISEDINWNCEKEQRANETCLELFTCSICLEYIRQNARFCENWHYMCNGCFMELYNRKKLKCPVCRGDFEYDCQSKITEQVLKLVKFPSDDH